MPPVCHRFICLVGSAIAYLNHLPYSYCLMNASRSWSCRSLSELELAPCSLGVWPYFTVPPGVALWNIICGFFLIAFMYFIKMMLL